MPLALLTGGSRGIGHYLDGGVSLHAPGNSVRWWRQTSRWPGA
jgi:hypothetical protein